jgi:hypothetical protein
MAMQAVTFDCQTELVSVLESCGFVQSSLLLTCRPFTLWNGRFKLRRCAHACQTGPVLISAELSGRRIMKALQTILKKTSVISLCIRNEYISERDGTWITKKNTRRGISLTYSTTHGHVCTSTPQTYLIRSVRLHLPSSSSELATSQPDLLPLPKNYSSRDAARDAHSSVCASLVSLLMQCLCCTLPEKSGTIAAGGILDGSTGTQRTGILPVWRSFT